MSSFLVSSSRETVVKENRFFLLGGGGYRRISPVDPPPQADTLRKKNKKMGAPSLYRRGNVCRDAHPFLPSGHGCGALHMSPPKKAGDACYDREVNHVFFLILPLTFGA